jgi:hypothetical protein
LWHAQFGGPVHAFEGLGFDIPPRDEAVLRAWGFRDTADEGLFQAVTSRFDQEMRLHARIPACVAAVRRVTAAGPPASSVARKHLANSSGPQT